MPPSVATLPPTSHLWAQLHAFRGVFTVNAGVSWYRVSSDKTSPSTRVSAAEMHEYEFYTPSKSVGSCLVVDVDRPEAVLEIFGEIPAEIHPSWVVETPRGAQAGWMIDPVDLRETAREHPIRYAQAVGHALRAAVVGDEAVDPLTPSRVRNPTYRVDLRASATPPVYGLRELHNALAAADLWPQGPRLTGRTVHRAAGAASAAAISEGNRNQTIFDVARHAAYRGEDYEAKAWETNDAADVPLSANEVSGIIRSISRYMSRARASQTIATVAMPSQMRDLLSDMGRRGGKANTAAQRAARAKSCKAATAARKAATDKKARSAQRMHARGRTRGHICKMLGISASTLCRWLRRFIPTVSLPEHQVIQQATRSRGNFPKGSRYTLRPRVSPRRHRQSRCPGTQAHPAPNPGSRSAAPTRRYMLPHTGLRHSACHRSDRRTAQT